VRYSAGRGSAIHRIWRPSRGDASRAKDMDAQDSSDKPARCTRSHSAGGNGSDDPAQSAQAVRRLGRGVRRRLTHPRRREPAARVRLRHRRRGLGRLHAGRASPRGLAGQRPADRGGRLQQPAGRARLHAGGPADGAGLHGRLGLRVGAAARAAGQAAVVLVRQARGRQQLGERDGVGPRQPRRLRRLGRARLCRLGLRERAPVTGRPDRPDSSVDRAPPA
jgi:hypothetical protein